MFELISLPWLFNYKNCFSRNWILENLKSNYFRIITEFSSGKFTEHFLSYQSINKLADKIETLIKKLKWLAILIRLINIIQYIQIILFSTTIINNSIDRSIFSLPNNEYIRFVVICYIYAVFNAYIEFTFLGYLLILHCIYNVLIYKLSKSNRIENICEMSIVEFCCCCCYCWFFTLLFISKPL